MSGNGKGEAHGIPSLLTAGCAILIASGCAILIAMGLCACATSSSEKEEDPGTTGLKGTMARYNLNMADKLFDQGKDALAVKYLYRAVRDDPLFLDPWLELVDYHLAREDMEAALLVFRSLPEELGKEPMILERTVFVLEEMGDRDGALAVVEKAVEAGATPESFKRILAESSLLSGDFERARDLLAQACSLDPEDAASLELYARICALTANGPEECETLMKLVLLCPDDPGMPLRAARAFERDGRGDEAIERLGLMIEGSSSLRAGALFRAQAFLYFQKEDWARAAALYLLTRERDGIYLERGERLCLAEALLREERTEESAALLEELLEERPDDAVVRAALAYAYWKSGSVVRAGEVVQSAPDPAAGNGILSAMRKRMGKGSVKR